MQGNTTGVGNVAVGFQAQSVAHTASYDTALGYMALHGGSAGGDLGYNTAVGYQADYTSLGGQSVAVGYQALYNGGNQGTYGAGSSVGVGYQAGWTTRWPGGNEVFIGWGAGYSNNTGTGDTAVGYNAGPSTSAQSNSTALGNGATTTQSNQVVIGNAFGIHHRGVKRFGVAEDDVLRAIC